VTPRRPGPGRGRTRTVRVATGLLGAALLAGAGAANAANWSPDDVRLSRTPRLALTSPSRQSLVRLPGDRLYAVWYERTSSVTSVVYGAERTPTGEWVAELQALSLGDSLVRNPVVAAGPAGELHLAWEDLRDGAEELFYRHRSPDGSWGPEERLTTGAGESKWPALGVAPDGRLHLAWSDAASGDLEIYHRWKDPDGEFSAPRRLTFATGESREPNLVVDAGGDVHLVWQDLASDPNAPLAPVNTEIFYRPLNGEGEPWTPPVRVSNALGSSQTPVLAIGPDNAIHVFWADNRDSSPSNGNVFPFAIWYRRWLPGLGFGHEKRYVYSAADHLNPSVATTTDNTINVVWEDYIHGNSEIYYRQIRPETGWDVQPTRLTSSVGPSRAPHLLAESDGTLHLLLSDAGSGEEGSIRYRAGRADATVPVRLTGSRLAGEGPLLRLTWTTTDERDHAGFLVFAGADADGDAKPVTPLISGGPDYEAVLDRAVLGEARVLRLVALSRGGTLETLAIFAIPPDGAEPVTAGLHLGAPFPNPARGAVVVPLALDAPAAVRLELFDLQGRRVSDLDVGILPAGTHQVTWDFRSATGALLPAGRYWLRARGPGADSGARGVLLLD
jgi:hypothetical protein